MLKQRIMTVTSSSLAPVLTTPRLTLRAHRLEDFDAYAAMWGEPDVVRLIGGVPRSREESWLRFLRLAGCWLHFGFGYWAVFETASGTYVGEAGFQEAMRDMVPSISGYPEAGWSMHPDHQGKGYASEAVAACHAWADREQHARTVCIIDPSNQPSLRVADKMGYRCYGQARYHDKDILMFERLRHPA